MCLPSDAFATDKSAVVCNCDSQQFPNNVKTLDNLPSQKFLFKKSLPAVAYALQANLTQYYENVEVNIVDCPDMTQQPFNLAAEGFSSGDATIVDLGGPANLLPMVNKSKVYDLATIGPKYLDTSKFPEGYYISGAGAGPWPTQGSNSEMIINMKVDVDGKLEKNKSRIISTSSCKCDKRIAVNYLDDETRCAMLANFMVSPGKRGKVLEVKCSHRINHHTNFTTSIRQALATGFKNSPVGLGGVFFIRNSQVQTFVMPDFSTSPLNSDQEVNDWLKYFQMEAPMLFQSVLVSADPGLDLRPEHSHGWGLDELKSLGGHYNHDMTPSTVEYHGYFAVANQLVRLDRPVQRPAAA